MSYGVTTEGFILKRLADIITETENKLKSVLGTDINLDPNEPLGQISGVLNGSISAVWELAQDVYNSQYPDSAQGASLEGCVSLIGMQRQLPSKTTVANQVFIGTINTIIPIGTAFSVPNDQAKRFVTDETITLVAGADEVQSITFSNTPNAGAFTLKYNTEETASLSYSSTYTDIQTALRNLPSLESVVVTGTFGAGFTITYSGRDGKYPHPLLTTGTNTLNLTGTATVVTIARTVTGVVQGSTTVIAETAGATSIGVNTLTTIETPVSGLTDTKNYSAGVTGNDAETDPQLKERRELSFQIAGEGTVEAIRAALLELSNVTSAFVFENSTNSTDGDGRPAKSYECVILGGDENIIADMIWQTKPAGIETCTTATGGNAITVTITDSQGFTHDIKFSRPEEVDIWIEIDLTTTSDYPADGDTQVINALLAYGATLGVGSTVVVYPKLISSINGITGIDDVEIRIGTAVNPTLDNNITMQPTQIAIFDAARITVGTI